MKTQTFTAALRNTFTATLTGHWDFFNPYSGLENTAAGWTRKQGSKHAETEAVNPHSQKATAGNV